MLDNSACQRTAVGSSNQENQGLAVRLEASDSRGVLCGAYSRQQQLDCVMPQLQDMQAVIAGCPAASSGT